MRPEQWVWYGNSAAARITRGVLWTPSLAYGLAARARAGAYDAGLLQTRRVGSPVIAVGNLTVGGTGKTPLAAWIASYYAAQGIRPAIVLRGYGGDEGDVHRSDVPDAIVLEDANRVRAAQRAIRQGAQVVVLDDAFQHLDIHRDLNLVVIAAESLDQPRRVLPAGPWREPWHGLRRADGAIITRKWATPDVAASVARRIRNSFPVRGVAVAHLSLGGFVGMQSGEPFTRNAIAGRRVVAGCGIADPAAFVAQLRQLGAQVQVFAWPDHHRFSRDDLRALLSAARSVDYVVTTAKDAVKLRRLWPAGAPEPFVAKLQVVWEDGRGFMEESLTNVLAMPYGTGRRSDP